MLGYDYPILGLLWTLLVIFMWVAWLMLVFRVIADIFNSRGLGGWAKGLWTLGVLLVPWLGTLIYLIVHGRSMGERSVEAARRNDEAFSAYVRDVAAPSAASELEKLSGLHSRGVLTDAEFAQQKAKLLA